MAKVRSNLIESLTDRQRQVLERIDRRASYKEIAHELDISPSRVSQYATLLKTKFEVNSLGELTEAYRHWLDDSAPPYNFVTSENVQLPNDTLTGHQSAANEEQSFQFADAGSDLFGADWAKQFEPRIVPRALDSKAGIWLRLGLIGLTAVIFLAVIVLGLSVMDTLSEFFQASS